MAACDFFTTAPRIKTWNADFTVCVWGYIFKNTVIYDSSMRLFHYSSAYKKWHVDFTVCFWRSFFKNTVHSDGGTSRNRGAQRSSATGFLPYWSQNPIMLEACLGKNVNFFSGHNFGEKIFPWTRGPGPGPGPNGPWAQWAWAHEPWPTSPGPWALAHGPCIFTKNG